MDCAYRTSDYVDILGGESLFSKTIKEELVIGDLLQNGESSLGTAKVESQGLISKFNLTT